MRAWQRMLSGRRLNLLEPSPVDIEIEDIAHGLSRVARWNGQTLGNHAYSVAEHCVLVEAIAREISANKSEDWYIAALLHDAPEYVIGDMISPFKNALGINYHDFEDKLQQAIHIRFGIPATMTKELKKFIKQADKYSAYLEATQIAGFSHSESQKFFGKPPERIKELKIEPLSPNEAKNLLIERFFEICPETKVA